MTREEEIEYQVGNLSDFAIAHGAPWDEFYKGFKEGAKWADEHPVNKQAEKDLALTWEDISTLGVIMEDVEQEFREGLHEDKDYIGYCKEVLNQYNKRKGR